MRRSTASTLVVILILLVAAALAVGTSNRNSARTSPTPNPTTAPTSSAAAAASGTPVTYAVKIYFSRHPDSDNDPSKVFAVARTSPTAGVGVYAVSQLVAGPAASESNYFTQVKLAGASNCGTDFSLSIAGGTATLKFCRSFDARGIVSDAQAATEIETTLKQFPTVTKVVILNMDGNCLFDAKGDNACKL